MARGELAYDDGKLFGRVGLNWMSERYFTYLNDESVDARLLADASLGYRFTDKIELQLNATNLFDKQYILSWSQLPGWQNYWSGRGRMVSLSHSIKF